MQSTMLYVLVEAVDECRRRYNEDKTPDNARLWALAVEILAAERRERMQARLEVLQ